MYIDYECKYCGNKGKISTWKEPCFKGIFLECNCDNCKYYERLRTVCLDCQEKQMK